MKPTFDRNGTALCDGDYVQINEELYQIDSTVKGKTHLLSVDNQRYAGYSTSPHERVLRNHDDFCLLQFRKQNEHDE